MVCYFTFCLGSAPFICGFLHRVWIDVYLSVFSIFHSPNKSLTQHSTPVTSFSSRTALCNNKMLLLFSDLFVTKEPKIISCHRKIIFAFKNKILFLSGDNIIWIAVFFTDIAFSSLFFWILIFQFSLFYHGRDEIFKSMPELSFTFIFARV